MGTTSARTGPSTGTGTGTRTGTGAGAGAGTGTGTSKRARTATTTATATTTRKESLFAQLIPTKPFFGLPELLVIKSALSL